MNRQISVLVISEDANEAALLRELLEKEFDGIHLQVERDESARESQKHAADVLVLAFRTLSAAEEFYLGFYRHADQGAMRSHGAIVLCARDEVRDAYRLCRRGLFDDYVVFWPASTDVTRLAMAVHTVIRRLESQRPLGTPASAEATDQRARSDTEHARVLIVDDDPAQRKLIGRLLERTGMELSFASSGAEALRSITQSPPALLLLDLRMPVLDGVEVLRRLRALPGGSELPVIVVSGSADRDSVHATLGFGVVDILVKPFDRDTLLRKVRRALDGVEPVGLEESPSESRASGS
jgi:CheY-like chemotaxis protein